MTEIAGVNCSENSMMEFGLFTALHTLGLIRFFRHDKSGSKPQYQGIEPSGPDSRYYLTSLSLDFDLRTETCSGRSLTPFFQAWSIWVHLRLTCQLDKQN